MGPSCGRFEKQLLALMLLPEKDSCDLHIHTPIQKHNLYEAYHDTLVSLLIQKGEKPTTRCFHRDTGNCCGVAHWSETLLSWDQLKGQKWVFGQPWFWPYSCFHMWKPRLWVSVIQNVQMLLSTLSINYLNIITISTKCVTVIGDNQPQQL